MFLGWMQCKLMPNAFQEKRGKLNDINGLGLVII